VSVNAIVGAILWIALAGGSALGLYRITAIELLFVLAPLVVVPLGLELSTRLGCEEKDQLPANYARWIQLPAALGVIASFWLPQGTGAAMLSVPWFTFGCFLGFSGFMRLVRGGFKRLKSVCVIMSFAYLPIGCAWLVASRYGLNPMGFQEPIVLLTAVHFHFAGFAAPLLTAATAATVERRAAPMQNIFRVVATGVLAGPGLLAAGFVVGPHLKLAAALLLVISEIGLALFFLFAVPEMRPRFAQALVASSSACVLFSMVLAAIWAVGEFPLQPFVHLAEMARFHGTANALGFTLCGLLGWTLSARGAVHGTGAASSFGPRSRR
jgi:hypothetical protein